MHFTWIWKSERKKTRNVQKISLRGTICLRNEAVHTMQAGVSNCSYVQLASRNDQYGELCVQWQSWAFQRVCVSHAHACGWHRAAETLKKGVERSLKVGPQCAPYGPLRLVSFMGCLSRWTRTLAPEEWLC